MSAADRKALAARVGVYALALSGNTTPNAFGLTDADRAGGRFDSLPCEQQVKVARVLSTAGVTL